MTVTYSKKKLTAKKRKSHINKLFHNKTKILIISTEIMSFTKTPPNRPVNFHDFNYCEIARILFLSFPNKRIMDYNKVRLFCIPFSGGNAYSYSTFSNFLPGNIELCNLELPGRGKRISEPLLYNIEAMTEDILEQMEDKTDNEYMIFGHSLGAILGINLCRSIANKGIKPPLRLFASGHVAPSKIKQDNSHLLPDTDFINLIREMEGTPEELLQDKSFVEFFLPVIRADFSAIGNYHYTYKDSPLSMPVSVLYGNQEDISHAEAAAWQMETESPISIHKFEGGHFFIFSQTEKICSLISREITS